MRKGFLLGLVFVSVFITGCVSSKKAESFTDVAPAANSVITDWSNKNLDVPAKPEWLKKLVLGISDVFKTEFSIESDYVVKYSVASAKTRDASLAASRVNYNAIRAEEIKTKVVSEAAATLNDEGLTEATSNAATLAKVDVSGHELVTQFWQKIETTENESKSEEYICYSVYKISKKDWLNTLQAFMKSVIPGIPDSKAQVKMAQTIQSLYDDTTKEVESTPEAVVQQTEAQLKSAQESGSDNVDWMKALDMAAKVIF